MSASDLCPRCDGRIYFRREANELVWENFLSCNLCGWVMLIPEDPAERQQAAEELLRLQEARRKTAPPVVSVATRPKVVRMSNLAFAAAVYTPQKPELTDFKPQKPAEARPETRGGGYLPHPKKLPPYGQNGRTGGAILQRSCRSTPWF